MLSYCPASREKPYEGNVTIFEVYDGDEGYIMQTIMKQYAWSPIVWSHCQRKEKNFYKAHYCALDFDEPEFTLDWAKRHFCDMWHIIGTTRSHQVEKGGIKADRFRVLLRFSRPICEVAEFKQNMKRIISHYGADENCYDGARCYYKCNEIISTNFGEDTYYEDVVAYKKVEISAERRAELQARDDERRGYGIVTQFMKRFMAVASPPGSRNKDCFVLGAECRRAGYSLDEATEILLATPTFRGTTDRQAEFLRTLANGYRNEDYSRPGRTKAT